LAFSVLRRDAALSSGSFLFRSFITHLMPGFRRARSSQSLKSAGCIIVTNELHNVGDPVSSGMMSIKSMGELSARPEINVHCRATCRRPVFESSIRRRDRHLIIREWVLHSQDGIFGTDRSNRSIASSMVSVSV